METVNKIFSFLLTPIGIIILVGVLIILIILLVLVLKKPKQKEITIEDKPNLMIPDPIKNDKVDLMASDPLASPLNISNEIEKEPSLEDQLQVEETNVIESTPKDIIKEKSNAFEMEPEEKSYFHKTQKFCPECGTPNDVLNKFCISCGYNFEK